MRREFSAPYHAALAAEIERVHARHGYAILLDGHSIRGEVPRFFAGRLPDLNLGTADGASCAPRCKRVAAAVLAGAAGFTHVVNGRFKGGWITRHYGRPATASTRCSSRSRRRATWTRRRRIAWDAARAAALVDVLRASSRRSSSGGRARMIRFYIARTALRRVAASPTG